MRRLVHSNTVALIELRESGQGPMQLVMPWYRMGSLYDAITENKLEFAAKSCSRPITSWRTNVLTQHRLRHPTEAYVVFVQVLSAVHYLHCGAYSPKHALIHRDIKPENGELRLEVSSSLAYMICNIFSLHQLVFNSPPRRLWTGCRGSTWQRSQGRSVWCE